MTPSLALYTVISSAALAHLLAMAAGPGPRGLSRPSGVLCGPRIVLLKKGDSSHPCLTPQCQATPPS